MTNRYSEQVEDFSQIKVYILSKNNIIINFLLKKPDLKLFNGKKLNNTIVIDKTALFICILAIINGILMIIFLFQSKLCLLI